MYIYDNVSLNSSLNEKYLRKNCTEIQNTHLMLNVPPPPPENCAFYETMWRNIVEPEVAEGK
jgi:hypothetical protein